MRSICFCAFTPGGAASHSTFAYRCLVPHLTRFTNFCCADPGRQRFRVERYNNEGHTLVFSIPYLLVHFNCFLAYFFDIIYSSMAFAAVLPAPIARITVAAPVTASPPAKTPSLEVAPVASLTIIPPQL